MDLKLNFKIEQNLNFSQNLRQSLDILSMSINELNDHLRKIMDKNPFILEKKDSINYDSFPELVDNSTNILSNLYTQIRIKFPPQEIQLANYLCQFLDKYGYFKGNKQEIINKINISSDKLENILQKLKKLDPIGIFSENLAELLKIQLEEKNILDEAYIKIIENLELIAETKFSKLAQISKISLDEIFERIKIIKNLNPRPTDLSSEEILVPIIADLILHINQEEFILEINEENMPQIYFDKIYYSSLKSKITAKSDKEYLINLSNEVIDLLRGIKNRNNSLIIIANEIITYQINFFLKGTNYLKPLTLNMLSEKLGYHNSTISRAIKNKCISTPNGYFQLKYFLSNSLANDKNLSSKHIKSKIKSIIDKEDIIKPLSDQLIQEILLKEGYNISRRTIVKYRQILQIPNSTDRKKQKLLDII